MTQIGKTQMTKEPIEFFYYKVGNEFSEFDEKNCTQTDSTQGSLYLKANVLTIILWTQV